MDQDLLAQILRNRQQSGVLADDPSANQDDFLSQLVGQAPPIPSEAEAVAQAKVQRAMTPGPGENVGDPTRKQLFPPEVYNDALSDAKSAITNREEAKKQSALDAILMQRRAMQMQGAPEDMLPKLPPNEEEIKRLQDKLSSAKGDKSDEYPPADPNEDRGMAESLGARHGEEGPDNERFLNALDKADAMDAEKSSKQADESDDEGDEETPTRKRSPAEARMLALIEAQRMAGQTAGMQMIGKGAERIAAGLAHKEADKNYLNEMTPMINQPVENVLNQQKLGLLGLEEESKGRDLKLKQDMDKVDSQVSDVARQILKRGAPDLKTDNLTATQMTQLIPGLKTVLETELNRENKKAIQEEKRKDNQDKQAKRDAEKQNNAYSEMSVKALGTRAPANVQLALKNSLFITQARELINKYPDLNKMPQSDVELLRTELARIAGGGVATGHGMKTLSTDTFNSQFKNLLSKAGNKPTGADLGKFLKNNASYLESLDKVQKNVVNDFHKGIFNAYKDKLRPDQQERYMSEHPGAFAENPDAPQGMVKIRRKADGAVKTLSASDATDFLKDPQFELVK